MNFENHCDVGEMLVRAHTHTHMLRTDKETEV